MVAHVTGPIIGSDCLCFYYLLVYIRHQRLIDITNLTVNGALARTHGGHTEVLAGISRYHAQLQEFVKLPLRLFLVRWLERWAVSIVNSLSVIVSFTQCG